MSDLPDDDSTVRLFGKPTPTPTPTRIPAPSQGDPSDFATGNALPAGTRLGEFEIRGIIGEGGFSVVYLAWDHSLHRSVALKEYIPVELAVRDSSLRVTARSQRQRETFDIGLKSFINEARLLASFDHHSLVKVHRFWEERGTAYMVMPWYQGPTLKAVLEGGKTPSETWLMRLLDPLTEALAVLHAEHCFHRDIAPDNIILLGAVQAPLLLDFGAARRVIGSMTHDLTAILKKGYAPLEQYGEIPNMQQGAWTDVYALAALVHFAIRGHTPPPSVSRLVDDTFVPLSTAETPQYSARFLEAINRALAIRPQHRTQSVGRLREELGLGLDIAADSAASPRRQHEPLAGPASPVPASGAAANGPGGKRVAVALSIGAALLAAAAAFYGWRSSTPPPSVEAVATTVKPAAIPVQAQAQLPPATPTTASAPATATPSASAVSLADRAAEQKAGEQARSLLADLQRLATNEKRDVQATVALARDKSQRAQQAFDGGHVELSLSYHREESLLLTGALNGLVDDLVARYRALAERATASGEFRIAQDAIDKAKKIAAMRR